MSHQVWGYRQTGIITKDLSESIKFHKDILGLELIQKIIEIN